MRSFLYWMFLFPVLGTAAVGFLAGIDISSRWGGPTLSLAGIVLLLKWPPGGHHLVYRRLITASFIWAFILPLTLLFTGLAGARHEMHHFPGRELAAEITRLWHETYQRPLRIVGGGWVAPDSIAFHSADHPSVLQHLSRQRSPWVSDEEIINYGMAVVCLDDDNLCISNTRKLLPGRALKKLTVTADPGPFFPGSERQFRYLFAGPGYNGIGLDTIAPMPMRQHKAGE